MVGKCPLKKLVLRFFFFLIFFSAALNIVLEEFVSEFLPGIAPQLQAALPSPSVDTPKFSFSQLPWD